MVKRLLAAGAMALGLSAFAQTQIEFWTYYLSPNFDNYIKSTIADFEKANPTIKVK
ncbi:MAG: hypothetical protein ACOYW9_02440 [Deinococcota bacterium]